MRKSTLWVIVSILMSLAGVCHAGLRSDINHDGRVDLADLAILASEWLCEEIDMRLGPELVLNGGFDTDVNWDKTGWVISASFATMPPSTYGVISQILPIVAGKTYCISWVGISNTGSLDIVFDNQTVGASGDSIIAAGDTFTLSFESTCSEFDVRSIDSVSVREVLPAVSNGDELSEAWAW